MPYKIIIVDDEKIIREGLANIMDWQSIGFEVVARLKDGREALEYIERNSVDVIVTDIKMTFVSGLEVAKYIYEQKPEIKVVLISGYKEFEFAQQAIKYNVEHYILKPTKLNELTAIFSDIKIKLDREAELRKQKQIEKQYLDEVFPLLKEQFFVDLFMGVLQDKEEIVKRIQLIGLDIDPEKSVCCFAAIKLVSYDEYVEKKWMYGKDKFHTAVKNYFEVQTDEIHYYPTYRVHDTLQSLILIPEKVDISDATAFIEQHFINIKSGFKELFDMEITLEVQQSFKNIFEIITKRKPIIPSGSNNSFMKMINEKEFNKLMEQQKLFMSYINAGNIKAVEALFDVFLKELAFTDARVIQNFVIDLFALLGNKLKDNGIDIYSATHWKFNYNEILVLNDIPEIRLWGKAMLNGISEYVSNSGKSSESNIIQKVKEYLNNNYSSDISLEDAADLVFLSPTYFSRIFKQQTGDNFIDYVVRLRIEKAKELLVDTQYKTYEISSLVGYKSARYFSKIFKGFTGFTPSEYRNSLCKGDETRNV